MLESKFERDMIIVQQHWNNFISLIKQDLNDLYAEQRKVIVEIKRIERVAKVLQHSQEKVDFLLLHKESIVEIDNSLIQKFAILDAFKRRNNLGNAVAVRTFNEILNSESIKKAIEQLEPLREKRDILAYEIDRVVDLIRGTAFDRDTIVKYSQRHGLSAKTLTALTLYPIFKSSKKSVPNNRKKTEIPIQASLTNTTENEVVQTHSEVEEILEIYNDVIEETPSYKEEFEAHKKRYDEIKNRDSLLLNKYYEILYSMAPVESQYYRIYCSMTFDELKEQQFEGEYDEVMAKIVAIKLFDAKNEIENMIQSIQNTNYSNKDDIEFFGEYVTEYQSLLDKLKEIDKKIVDTRKSVEEWEESKVFFLTDSAMQPFIPDSIKQKGYQGSLRNIIQKAQEGYIQNKKSSNIMPLKVNKKFKDEVGRTVFAVRNFKIIVSYIKLNSGTGLNDGGIMILTASLLNPNTIQEDTDKVIGKNRGQIIRQLQAIEKGDPRQIALQAMIREELTQALTKEETLEEGESNGRKTR